MDSKSKLLRNYGYDILINNFEAFLRNHLCEDIFFKHYGTNWQKYIPQGVVTEVLSNKDIPDINDISMEDFFEELTFLNLKDIIISFGTFRLMKSFLGELSKDKFIEIMDKLNIYRRKIAHAKSIFGNLDLFNLIEYVEYLCQGEASKPLLPYLHNEQYKNAKEVPPDFLKNTNIRTICPLRLMI